MNITTNSGATPLDRTQAEATLYRVAICALTYYADKPHDEPGYTIDEDLTWCIAPLLALDTAVLDQLRESIRNTIADPTAHRGALNRVLTALTAESGSIALEGPEKSPDAGRLPGRPS